MTQYRNINQDDIQDIANRSAKTWKRAQANLREHNRRLENGTHDPNTCPWEDRDNTEFENALQEMWG